MNKILKKRNGQSRDQLLNDMKQNDPETYFRLKEVDKIQKRTSSGSGGYKHQRNGDSNSNSLERIMELTNKMT